MSDAIATYAGPVHRLIATAVAATNAFDGLLDPQDAACAERLAALSSDLYTVAGGRRTLLGAAGGRDRRQDPMVLAAFLAPPPGGGRFGGPALGTWSGSADVGTAVVEAFYHHTRRLRASATGFPAAIRMRAVTVRLTADLDDLRPLKETQAELFHGTDYRASQAFGEARRAAGAAGILYPSLRRVGGENVVVYRPELLEQPRPGDLFEFRWDASGQPSVLKLSRFG